MGAETHAPYWLIMRVFDRPAALDPPLRFPDASAEFFGYDNRTVRQPDGSEAASTRNLVRVTGWIAAALLAHRAAVAVPRKGDCHQAYRRHVGDEWAELLDQIYQTCRGRWGYLIPEGREERDRLREICRRTLQLERHFLDLYRRFLLAELRHHELDGNHSPQPAGASRSINSPLF